MEFVFRLEPPVGQQPEGYEGSQPLVFKNVVVLAKNFQLSPAQESLLEKGLTFVPTINIHKNQKQQLTLDIQRYHQKIQLISYFKNTTKWEPKPFTAASTWLPPPNLLPPQVHRLMEQDTTDFKNTYRPCRERANLKLEELRALRDLMHNRNIVIKPADKGSAIVILSRDQYIFEVNRQLSDQTYYKKLDGPIFTQTIPMVRQIMDQLHRTKFISAKQKAYIIGQSEPRPRRFYVLPKIHKDPESWTVPGEIPPGRPIVSDCGSDTYGTAEYIDHFLYPLSIKHPAYIKDTYHFIELVRNLSVPLDSLFFTIDVESLYTNIDIPAGLATVRRFFQKFPDMERPDEQILKLLEINLTRNDFEFNGEYYLQIKGTAMGKRFAPSYANMFMADWEEQALAKCPIQPLHYLRYLDDIFGVWVGSREELENFVHTLNTHDPSIKLKHKITDDSIDFLDTTIYKGRDFAHTNKLDIKVFFKSTDTHALLYKSSFHPKHTYQGLIKSQLIRFKRICTGDDDFSEAVRVLFQALRRRGYSRTFLRKCRRTFQVSKPEDQRDIIPLISTFSTAGLRIHKRLKTNFEQILGQHGIFGNHKVISAYRRNKNLRDYLVRARLSPAQQKKTRNSSIPFVKLAYVKNRTTSRMYKLSQNFSPRTSNCVYVIFCTRCNIQYIGETKNSISTRMWQHKYNITHNKEGHTPLVRHFIHHGLQSLKIAGIEGNFFWTEGERRRCEKKWIRMLNTLVPGGLNIRWG